jgi:hypothetical protein
MRRLCRLATEVALLATLALGCGSSGEDGVVLRFMGFGPNETSATVCVRSQGDTSTTANASFLNEEAADIHLNAYTVHYNDASVGLGDITASITGNPTLIGGRCRTLLTKCAVSADCVMSGETEPCDHTVTTVEGIVLVDPSAQTHVNPKVYGQATSLTVTFTGVDDAHHTFQVPAGYALIFNDSIDCGDTTGPTPVVSPVATATATATATETPTPTTTPGVS